MIKGLIQDEDITIVNIYAPNIGAPQLSKVTQSCPTLCDPIDCSLSGSSVHGIFPGKSAGVDCHFLLQDKH